MTSEQSADNMQSRILFDEFSAGDEDAAKAIVEKYWARLKGLARSSLNPDLRRRFDEEDVVNSALRSFFRRARGGAYTISEPGALWHLLSTITKNKLLKHVETHNRQMRSIKRVSSEVSPDATPVTAPDETEVSAVMEELQFVMDRLPPRQRVILTLRLDDVPLRDIAGSLSLSERTVRRELSGIEEVLVARFNSD